MNFFETIKDQVSIYTLLQSIGIQVPRTERGWKIYCPFHDDNKTKSAYVYPDSNSLYCFSCVKGWDVIAFWAEHNEWKVGDKLDYVRAAKDLAAKYGIKIVQEEWETRYTKLGEVKPSAGFADATQRDRILYKQYYGWQISNLLSEMPNRHVDGFWLVVDNIWTSFEEIEVKDDSWNKTLVAWYRDARRDLQGIRESQQK